MVFIGNLAEYRMDQKADDALQAVTRGQRTGKQLRRAGSTWAEHTTSMTVRMCNGTKQANENNVRRHSPVRPPFEMRATASTAQANLYSALVRETT